MRDVNAPHGTVVDPALQSSALCAQCHGFYETGERIVGKEMQTFLEWQRDYFQPGLGKQQCQDCHMPRTLRKRAEGFDVPPRAVARHLWTGGCSRQRHLGSLSLTVVREQVGSRKLSFHVSNIGAGHSVPTGMARRAVYLRVEVLDMKGNSIGGKEWMFAPFKGDRPDDKAFLQQDEKLGAAGAALARGDAQGPHEANIRAGEERVLNWEPALAPGKYTVKARLSYALDRFAERPAVDDRSVLAKETLSVSIP
ncbi:hypothetical protein AMPC_38960 [Anaeromyxobacter paludicola]|uniref:Cytochrome c-552/4 domain-containing protein n=1 Tax=Anaeromyxobacter paludicola TaxID=2918171 RepID=A0ABN6NFF9_9BACT|nr:hypothetical protein AMPC_38960 [Anaeromyxobacter paludicola]